MRQIITNEKHIDFSFLKNFSKIVVTGPQRSGTNLLSQHLLDKFFEFAGYQYVDELEFDFYLETRFAEKMTDKKKMVIQAPTMSHLAHHLDAPNTFVFFCIRKVSDIINSEERAGWNGHKFERANYRRSEFDQIPISQAKYDYWFFEQRAQMKCPFGEVHFSAMESSSIWSNKAKTGFQPDTSWKPESAKDDGNKWALVEGPNGVESMKVVKYWFEEEENIEKCRTLRK